MNRTKIFKMFKESLVKYKIKKVLDYRDMILSMPYLVVFKDARKYISCIHLINCLESASGCFSLECGNLWTEVIGTLREAFYQSS